MRIRNERGMALAISLLVVMLLLIIGSVFVFRSITEKNIFEREKALTQSFYLADGGSHAGLKQIDSLINTDMRTTINGTNPQTVANDAKGFVLSGDGLGFLVKYAKKNGSAQLVLNGQQATYAGTITTLGGGTYQFTIVFTEKGNPVNVATDKWDFSYNYNIQTTGIITGQPRKVRLTGDFTVRVQKDNFAKYALFTNQHRMPSGTLVWFTAKTNFAGPIHTNDQYNFASNPSGTFEGLVTQQNTKARFYNQGFSIQMDADSNPPYDVPTFNGGYDRGVAEIVLSSSVKKQDLIDQSRGGDTTTGNGIFVANDGVNLTGGIYVKGDATVNMGVDTNDNQTYTITQGSTTKIITVRLPPTNQTQIETVSQGTITYGGLPDGIDNVGTIIYVNGNITSVKGTIQEDTQVTVSSENGATITDHVLYSDFTPAIGTPGQPGYVPPNAEGTENLFGLLTWGGNIAIGTAAPNNLDIHGVMLAQNTGSNAIFTVTNYNSGSPRGTVSLLGGAITQFYGAFGTFSGETGQLLTGYGRNFVYDNRMLQGEAPPYFPTMKTFIAFTNDITDKIAWQEGGF